MHKVTLNYVYESKDGKEKTNVTTEIDMSNTDINEMARFLREFLIASTFSADTVDKVLLVKGYNYSANHEIINPALKAFEIDQLNETVKKLKKKLGMK